ncbi:MAG: Hsp20/alpha crystallin family protein [Acidobacteria bacterium]|jgi:HSP20 family protein|nr:Hsp20/alpha crystallin family protein [Acidobacteriota bacterium]
MARMTIWQQPREMARFADDMTRLMNEVFSGRSGRESVRGSWTPPVDVRETADAIKLEIELPGFSSDNVDVTLENSMLTISGERSFEEAAEGETCHRVERTYGSFERSFQVPNNVDPAKIDARFDSGVLYVSLPKREESKPRSIKVSVK